MGAHEPRHLQSKHLAAQSKRSPKAFDDLKYPIMWLVGWVWGRRGPGKHWVGEASYFPGAGWRLDPFCSRAHTNKLQNWSVFVCFPSVRLVTQLDETSYLMYEHNVFISQVFFFGSLQVTNVSCKNTFLQFKIFKKNMFFLSFTLKIVLVMIHHPHTHTKKCEFVTKSWDR